MTCARFRRGGTPVPKASEDPNPGRDIVEHLLRELPRRDIPVGPARDVEYAHEIPCHVDDRTYRVAVSFDWVSQGWWEVFYAPTLTWFHRLMGRSESDQQRRLSVALHESLATLPGVGDLRWYAAYETPVEGRYSPTPLGD